MNLARALANVQIQGILDGSTDRDRRRAWEDAYQRAQDPRERVRAEAAAREKKQHDESFKRLEARMHARRAARLAKEAATRGEGWAVLEHPRVSHQEIERLTRQAWGLAFHQIPFPPRWKVRWARLRSTIPGDVTMGMAVRSARLILLNEQAARGRSWRDLLETVCHELVHVAHDVNGGHGPAFEASLRAVLAFVLPEDELAAAPLAAAPPAAPPRPEPHTGRTFTGRPHLVTGRRWGPKGWFDRPGLQPDLEYRG